MTVLPAKRLWVSAFRDAPKISVCKLGCSHGPLPFLLLHKLRKVPRVWYSLSPGEGTHWDLCGAVLVPVVMPTQILNLVNCGTKEGPARKQPHKTSNIRAETSTHYVWTAFVQGPRVGAMPLSCPVEKGWRCLKHLPRVKGTGGRWDNTFPPPPLSDHSEQRLPASQGKILAEACSVFRVS